MDRQGYKAGVLKVQTSVNLDPVDNAPYESIWLLLCLYVYQGWKVQIPKVQIQFIFFFQPTSSVTAILYAELFG